jgi:hypothetical protein
MLKLLVQKSDTSAPTPEIGFTRVVGLPGNYVIHKPILYSLSHFLLRLLTKKAVNIHHLDGMADETRLLRGSSLHRQEGKCMHSHKQPKSRGASGKKILNEPSMQAGLSRFVSILTQYLQ